VTEAFEEVIKGDVVLTSTVNGRSAFSNVGAGVLFIVSSRVTIPPSGIIILNGIVLLFSSNKGSVWLTDTILF
jgi:hypothetical protein